MRKNWLLFMSVVSALLFILAGCFKGEQSLSEVDPPQDLEANDDEDENRSPEETNDNDDSEDIGDPENQVTETYPRQLYLMDVNGMIAEQIIELPLDESKEVATQVLSHLVKEGPVTSLLPNGFQAVLPAGTEILGLNLQEDGSLIVDLSEEFKEYEAEDELKILQSMTYTLTQFDNVDDIKLRINGHPQDTMPVDDTPIADGYSRANGINIIESDTIDFMTSQAVTMYFPTEYNENRYYVPVTKYVPADDALEEYETVVKSLLEGPGYDTNLTQVFNNDTTLLDTPVLEEGTLELVFNENILKDPENAVLADEVMETLVRTLTEQNYIDAIEVKVDNMDTLLNENGEAYKSPVTSQTFMEKEKL